MTASPENQVCTWEVFYLQKRDTRLPLGDYRKHRVCWYINWEFPRASGTWKWVSTIACLFGEIKGVRMRERVEIHRWWKNYKSEHFWMNLTNLAYCVPCWKFKNTMMQINVPQSTGFSKGRTRDKQNWPISSVYTSQGYIMERAFKRRLMIFLFKENYNSQYLFSGDHLEWWFLLGFSKVSLGTLFQTSKDWN